MGITHDLGWAIITALAATGVAAQDPPGVTASADENEIVVERDRIVDTGAAAELAETIGDRPRASEPLARFRKPLCLTLAMDDPERGQQIGQRIIANARAAGLEIDKPGCQANAMLLIADDVRGQIEERRSSGRRFFFGLKRHQIDRAMKVTDPVYVFHDIVFKTNRRAQVDRSTKKNMMNVVMMIEKNAAASFSARQIADYASLRLLAPTREMTELAGGAMRTVLTLFSAPETAPTEMSVLDREYLGALYSPRANGNAIDVLLTAAEAAAEDDASP